MATLYFYDSVDGNWAQLGNWWQDATYLTQASALPTSSDDVIINAPINTNSGGVPQVANFTYNSIEEYYIETVVDGVGIVNAGFFIGDISFGGGVTFNNSAYNNGTVSGNATFNSGSSNYGTVTLDATFNGTSSNDGTVSGNATFNDTSSNYYVSGNATFNDASSNNYISGNATFNDASYNNYGAVTGDATFNGTSYNNGNVTGNATFNDTSYNNGTVTLDATFNGTSSNNGTVSGNATFNDASYNYGTVTGNATFNGTSYNNGDVFGDATFNGSAYNDGIVYGNATFNGTSYNNGDAFGDATFNGSAYNDGIVYGNATFNDTSSNSSTVNGNAIVDYTHAVPFDSSNGNTGSVTDYILYANFPTLYYNNATTDNNWANNLNWWVDSAYSQQSADIPVSSTTVYIYGNVTSDSSSSATADTAYFEGGNNIAINLNIVNDATFTDNSYGDGSSSITLTANNVYFDSTSGSYSITANANISFGDECRLTGSSTNSGTITANGAGTGSAYFDDSSINAGTVGYGASAYTVDFSDSSTNSGTVNINANVNYPVNRNTFNTGSIVSITYVSYPTFYFYGGNDWHNSSYWWTGTGGTGDNAAYVPNSLDAVAIQASPSETSSSMFAYIANIETTFVSTQTLTITGELYVNSGSISDGFVGATIIALEATFEGTSSIFNGGSLTVTNNVNMNTNSSINGGSVTATLVAFYGDSTFDSGSITGNATIYSPHPLPFNVGGSLGGTLTYSGYSPRTVYYNGAADSTWGTAGNWWNDDSHTIPAEYAPDNAISLDNVVINGNITSSTFPFPAVDTMTVKAGADISINIDCYTATFEDNSTFSYYNHTYNYSQCILTQSPYGSVSITFTDLSANYGIIYVADPSNSYNPPVVFEDGTYIGGAGVIYGNVEIYYPVSLPYDMTIIGGSVTYFGYGFYFNDNVAISPTNDGDWNNSNNWYLDSSNTILAGSTPSETYPGANITLQTSVSTYTGGTPTAYNLSCGSNSSLSITNTNIIVNGLATFENDGTLGSGAIINGDALFKDTSTCEDGGVNLTATFTLSSAATMIHNGYNGTYGSNATDVQFEYGKGINGSSILGIV